MERQSSLVLLKVEGREFDLTNLLPARKANSWREPSLYPAKEEILKCAVDVDGVGVGWTANGRTSMMRSQSCRDADKLEPSLYPDLKELDSSLDTEDVAELFRKLWRRKSTGTIPNKALSTVSQVDLLIKSKMKLEPMSSNQSDSGYYDLEKPKAAMTSLSRAPEPPRSYSINRGSRYRKSEVVSDSVDASLPGALYVKTVPEPPRSHSIGRESLCGQSGVVSDGVNASLPDALYAKTVPEPLHSYSTNRESPYGQSEVVGDCANASLSSSVYVPTSLEEPSSHSIYRRPPCLQSEVVSDSVDGSLPDALNAKTSLHHGQSASSDCHKFSSETEARSTANEQAKNSSRPTSPCRKIEIAPGVVMDLRGALETVQAIESGVAASVTCAWCEVSLLCVPDAEAVICPDCRVLTPVMKENCKTKHLRRRGVGLGLKDDPVD